MEGSSSLHSGKMQQQNRQSFRVEPANMAKSVSYSHDFSLKLHSGAVLNSEKGIWIAVKT